MSLNFAAITPHPPIIIPEIGKENIDDAKDTVLAMEQLERKFNQADIDTIIIISPHAESRSFAMTIFAPPEFSADFGNFEAPNVKLKFPSDKSLALNLASECQAADILIEVEAGQISLDHGAMVPLYYLTKNTGRSIKLIEIAFSSLPPADHIEFGRVIGEVVNGEKDRIALIASGDMSHRIFDEHYCQYGKKFDRDIVDLIKNHRLSEIINIDEDLVDLAGECGYRSLLILAGALNEKHYQPELLSYEAPFGVGYLVANFEL